MNFKNKGLMIELTSLLDVILIMLFWVMMNTSGRAEEAEQKAAEEISAANAQVEQIKEETSAEIDRMSEYVTTVEGFEKGEMLTISITYKSEGDVVEFSRGNEEITSVILDVETDIEEEIRTVLDGVSQDGGIILAALVYDGDTVLYRDVTRVMNAVENLRSSYRSFYFAYVNTSA